MNGRYDEKEILVRYMANQGEMSFAAQQPRVLPALVRDVSTLSAAAGAMERSAGSAGAHDGMQMQHCDGHAAVAE
eukprot:4892547-Pleurochrysis_carterae.AAC.1